MNQNNNFYKRRIQAIISKQKKSLMSLQKTMQSNSVKSTSFEPIVPSNMTFDQNFERNNSTESKNLQSNSSIKLFKMFVNKQKTKVEGKRPSDPTFQLSNNFKSKLSNMTKTPDGGMPDNSSLVNIGGQKSEENFVKLPIPN